MAATTGGGGGGGAAPAANAGLYARYVLLVLVLIYISNQWSRYLLNYLYAVSYDDDDDGASRKSITAATDLSASEYGLLVGYAFSFFYVVMGLFTGRAADVYNRVNIIGLGLLIWNAATLYMGMCHTFAELAISRVFLGIGQAFSAPASYSLIADYFPVHQRAQANGIYAFGVYVGGGLSSLSIVMASSVGWRGTCYIVAVVGFALTAMLLFTVREPQRSSGAGAGKQQSQQQQQQQQAEDERFSAKDAFRAITGSTLLVLLFIAGSVRFMAGYAIGGYFPVFFDDYFSSHNTAYSYLNASVVAVGGALSSWVGGKLADSWEASGNRRARLYVPALGAMLAIPFTLMTLLATNFYVSMFGLFLEYVVAECWFGPAISVIQNALPSRARGVGIASFTFLATMFGSLMTWVLGLIIDANTISVRAVLVIAVCGSYMIAAFLFLLASRYIDEMATPEERVPLMKNVDPETADEAGSKQRQSRNNPAVRTKHRRKYGLANGNGAPTSAAAAKRGAVAAGRGGRPRGAGKARQGGARTPDVPILEDEDDGRLADV